MTNKVKLVLACIPVILWLFLGFIIDHNPIRLDVLLMATSLFLMCFLISLEQIKAKMLASLILFVFVVLLCYEGYIKMLDKALYGVDYGIIIDYPKFIFIFASYYLIICYWPKKK